MKPRRVLIFVAVCYGPRKQRKKMGSGKDIDLYDVLFLTDIDFI